MYLYFCQEVDVITDETHPNAGPVNDVELSDHPETPEQHSQSPSELLPKAEDEESKPPVNHPQHLFTPPYYEQFDGVQMPPLIQPSPRTRLAGRSRLWGIWTDSVRLQRRLEKLESVAHCCIEEYDAGGWF